MSAPDFERIERARALIEAGNSIIKTAQIMGMSRSQVYNYCEKHGIKLPHAGTVQARKRKPRLAPSPSTAVASAEDEASEGTFAIADELIDEINSLVASDLDDGILQEALLAGFDAILGVIEPTPAA